MADMTRDEEIKAIRKDYPLAFPLMVGLLAVIVLLIIGMVIYTGHSDWGYGINVFTSVVSTVATVLILDRLAERRADRKAEEALKRQLIMDAGSTSNEIAKNAVHQLSKHEDEGWLVGDDGLLKGQNLVHANLKRADLQYANLQKANLLAANLRNANLLGAKLQEASLYGAELYKTRLQWAKLQNADMTAAQMIGTDLQGADLRDADMKGATLIDPVFDKFTILPDGNTWSEENNDTGRFTDQYHRSFWRSPNPDSPAHKGWKAEDEEYFE